MASKESTRKWSVRMEIVGILSNDAKECSQNTVCSINRYSNAGNAKKVRAIGLVIPWTESSVGNK